MTQVAPAALESRTRDRILQAALEVFAQKGYHRALVDDIVRAAYLGEKASLDPFAAVRIARASSEIDAAWALLTNNIREFRPTWWPVLPFEELFEAFNRLRYEIAMVIVDEAVVSKPTAVPEMMFVAGPVLDASAISRTGRNVPAV